MTITLTAELDRFLEAEVAAGRYVSVSDAVRDAVERLRRDRALDEVRGKIAEGICDLDEGRASEARTQNDVATIRARILQKAIEKSEASRGA